MKSQKIKNIIPYLTFAVFCTVILISPFGNFDELWNYSFAKNIAKGLVPYRDFSIVQTPLSAYIPAFFMAIFGDGLFTHRVVGCFLLFGLTALMFRLCKKTTGSALIGFICAIFVACIMLPFYIYNYNYLSALIVLVILEIEISGKKESGNILIGLLTGTLLLVKQNTGAMLMIANLAICMINIVKFKMNKKIQLARVAVSGLPIALFLIYLFLVGAVDDFFDYAVLGITTFVHRTTPLELIAEAPFYAIYVAFAFFAYVYMIIRLCKDGMSPPKLSGLLFALAWLMVTYPLFDAFHLVCVFIVLAPVFCMFIKQKKYRLWEEYTCFIVVLSVCVLSVMAFIPFKEECVLSSLNNYEYIPISKDAEKNVQTICEYISAKQEQGYDVRMADASAIAFKIPLDHYEKNWDLLLVGNVGTNSAEDLLTSSEKCLYLVYRHTEELGKQNHFEVIEYIKENYVKVEEVLMFDVYEKG